MPRLKKKRIHVSQPAIRQNLKDAKAGKAGYEPVISVKFGGRNIYGHEVQILDKDGHVLATVMQPRCKTLSCGARVWIETTANVRVVNNVKDEAVLLLDKEEGYVSYFGKHL